MTAPTAHPIVWLRHAGQRLGLVPTLGGAVAAWRLDPPNGGGDGTDDSDADPDPSLDLWRPWDGITPDLYRLASFAMVPWSNRISGGGFEQDGRFHPMRPNRAGEPYPIHGDGWLQAWTLSRPAEDMAVLTLASRHVDGAPYDYEAVQTFRLVEGGLDQAIEVTHRGADPLPYGLGLHPWFPRAAGTRVWATVDGVWTSGADPIPTGHTTELPAGWDLNAGLDVALDARAPLIDNGFSGWDGRARIEWPERDLCLTLTQREPRLDGAAPRGCCLVYRPPEGPAFCFEPISHPIDAFHMPGRPGLRVLATGESMRLAVAWRFGSIG